MSLCSHSDGIDPPTEAISLTVGSWSLDIPAGSFVTRGQCFDYQGESDGQHVYFTFRETATDSYRILIKVDGTGVNTLTDPTPVRLRVGNDGATASVNLRGRINGASVDAQAGSQP